MRQKYPYKEYLITVNSYESPPDGWRWSGLIEWREGATWKRKEDIEAPDDTAYQTEEEAQQAGLAYGKVVIDRML